MARAGRPSARCPSSIKMSSFASSAQCTSSRTTMVGLIEPSSSTRAANTACGFSPRSTTSARGPCVEAAMSRNGPSGRGVCRPSLAPQRTRAPLLRSSQKRWTRTLFPMPASPARRTTRPRPPAASARHSSSVATNPERSSSPSSASRVVASLAISPTSGGSCICADADSRPATAGPPMLTAPRDGSRFATQVRAAKQGCRNARAIHLLRHGSGARPAGPLHRFVESLRRGVSDGAQ